MARSAYFTLQVSSTPRPRGSFAHCPKVMCLMLPLSSYWMLGGSPFTSTQAMSAPTETASFLR